MRPLIGVFTSERHAGKLATLQRCDEARRRHGLRLGTPYLRAVEAAGGLPVVLAPDGPAVAGRCSTASTACASPAARTSTRSAYGAGERHEQLGETDRPSSRRARARPRGGRARPPAPGDLPRRAGDERRPRRDAPPARRRSPPDRRRPPSRSTPSTSRRARSSPAVTGAGALAGQLLPPPGGRRASAPACARRHRGRTARSRRSRTRHPFFLGVQWHAESGDGGRSSAVALRGRCRRGRGSGCAARARRPSADPAGVLTARLLATLDVGPGLSCGVSRLPSPSASAASSSASARSPRSTASTSRCPRARASACSAPTARASRRR